MSSRPKMEADMVSSAMPPASDPRELQLTIAHIVAGHAARRGDAIAVEDAERRLTYAELAALAEHVGRQAARVAQGEGPVGILLPPSAAYVAAIVGLLARGVAYVPMDASFPAARNGDIAARAGLKAVIVDQDTASAVHEMAPGLAQIEMPASTPSAELQVTAKPDDVAVIFYTSGSTGQPKGVFQDQRSILYEVLRHCWRAGLTEDDGVALVYSPSVSGSTRDIYGSLAAGARLCVVDVRREGLGATVRAMADWQVSVLHSIPGLFRSMFASESPDSDRLARGVRLIHLISDRVLPSDVALYQQRFPQPCRLCVDLATTETYSYASWYLDHDTVIDRPLVPVGYPRPDVELRLVDDGGRPVEPGALGEIVVTGRALSLGYWRDDALTQARFSPAAPGATSFRTGDLGRLLPDGLLEFVGRKDRQVKLRGNTVHLAEVEAVLALCPGVAEAGAVARGEASDARLIAYCAPEPGASLEPATIAAWCAERLARFMQPAEVVVLDALPRLPSGKPDAVELERLDATRAAASVAPAPAAGLVVSASAAMRAVCDGWEALVQAGAFDRDLTFEEAGGDSLKGLALLLFLEHRLGRRLPTTLLDMTTRPSELISRLTAPGLSPTGREAIDRPVLMIFAGLFGPDVPTVDFARQLEPRFFPVVVDYRWGGDDFDGSFSAERLFDTIVAMARQTGSRRLWLLGSSYGGKIAAEAARRIAAVGLTVEFVGVLDGLPRDTFLKRHSAALRGMILADRTQQGVELYGNAFAWVSSGLARRLSGWLASHRRYGLLRWFLKLLSVRGLTAANMRARRAVVAQVRLSAFKAMPAGPVGAQLWLFLSNEDRFEPSLYPNLGWDAYFGSIEAVQLDVPHLGFFKDDGARALLARLADIEARLQPG